MKTTAKEYQANVTIRKELRNSIQDAKASDNWKLAINLETLRTDLNSLYFEKLDKVNISFWIGYRKYYREVSKIGNSYFDHGERMTKGRGYRNIIEIDKITEKMNEEMISDSYYY